MDKKWYVVHALSGFEKHVMRALQERVELIMQAKFGEVLVPSEEVVEMKAGKTQKRTQVFSRIRPSPNGVRRRNMAHGQETLVSWDSLVVRLTDLHHSRR